MGALTTTLAATSQINRHRPAQLDRRLYATHSLLQDASPSFGEPTQVVDTESGVLDAKWHTIPATETSNDRSGRGNDSSERQYLASACASGSVHIYQLSRVQTTDSNALSETLSLVASSEASDVDGGSGSRLALSLDWDRSILNAVPERMSEQKIVSSYSDGSISIHSFNSSLETPSLAEKERWDAHTLFGCPSEVWTCSFAASSSTGSSPASSDGSNLVLSGGDDCTLKLWDVRSLPSPVAKVGSSEFEAGVTAVSYHPKLENLFAVGSYDEVIRLYDIRMLGGEPVCRVNVGGGVWRIRWHPTKNGRMLVGAMHGGCRIVNFKALTNINSLFDTDRDSLSAEIESEFTDHNSMAYGADWLVRDGGSPEYAASCSFYDRRVCMWMSTATNLNTIK